AAWLRPCRVRRRGRTTALRSRRSAEALSLWLHQPDPLLAGARARGRAQPRTDLADEAIGAGLSHHCQFPPGQLEGAQGDEPGVCAADARTRPFGRRGRGDRRGFFDGNASKGSIKTQRKLAKRLAEIEREIEAYGAALDANDSAEAERPPAGPEGNGGGGGGTGDVAQKVAGLMAK